MLFRCDLLIIIDHMRVIFKDSHMTMILLRAFKVLTATSKCKPEGIFKDADINNASLMCLFFAGIWG
jgi:hypothetical protein